MSDKPMIFSTPMIKALLNTKPGVWPAEPIEPGKPFKSMTRRVLKYEFLPGYNPEWTGYKPVFEYGKFFLVGSKGESATKPVKLPYQPGDRIWVRETFSHWEIGGGTGVCYKATDSEYGRPWQSPRFMPKKYARIWLTVMAVRVRRLWEITDEDAQAEGISFDTAMEYSGWTPSYNDPDGSNAWPNYTDAYKDLWDSLNAKRGYPFDTNPYVTVIEFRRDE